MDSLFGGGVPPSASGYGNMGDQQKARVGARESDLDRLQSALEKAEHPKPQNNSGIPLSEMFDIGAFVRDLDSHSALDTLRRHSQASQQTPLMQQSLGAPVTAPQLSHFGGLQQSHGFTLQMQQQAYYQQQVCPLCIFLSP